MPFALVVIGLLMIVTGINNTYSQFGAQLQKDAGFLPWALAIFVVGLIGNISDLRTFSHYFMALILISVILANSKQGSAGFFSNLSAAIKAGPTAPQATAASSSSSGVASGIISALTSSPSSGSGAAPAAGSTSTTSGTGIFGSGFGLFK
jgi:hypothetical protein